MRQLGASVNLVICQKSKVDDWIEHFESVYNFNIFPKQEVYNLTNPTSFFAAAAFARRFL